MIESARLLLYVLVINIVFFALLMRLEQKRRKLSDENKRPRFFLGLCSRLALLLGLSLIAEQNTILSVMLAMGLNYFFLLYLLILIRKISLPQKVAAVWWQRRFITSSKIFSSLYIGFMIQMSVIDGSFRKEIIVTEIPIPLITFCIIVATLTIRVYRQHTTRSIQGRNNVLALNPGTVTLLLFFVCCLILATMLWQIQIYS